MADYKVGNLQIAFEAIDKTSADFKELAKNLRALQRLITNIGNANLSPFVANVEALRNAFSPLLADIQGVNGALSDLNSVIQTLGVNNVSKAASDFSALQQEVAGTDTETKELNSTIENGTPLLSGARTEVRGLSRELNNNSNATKKGASGWKKFIKSIGRIAMYRAIRRALQMITGAITESIQEFAKVDDNVNNTMSQITSSLQVIKLSFGATFLPLLQAIAPILQQIAVGFANVANVISASLSGGDTYWAVNAQAIQDYREQLEKTTGSLAGFDKIQSLSGQSAFSFLEERSVKDLNKELGNTKWQYEGIAFLISSIGDLLSNVLDLINKIGQSSVVKTIIGVITWVVGGLIKVASWLIEILNKSGLIEPILGGILGYLIAIGATKIITLFTSGAVKTFFVNLIAHLKNTKNGLLGVLTSTQALAVSIGALAGSVMFFISSLDDMGSTAKWLVPLIAGVTAVVVGLTTALVAMYSAHLGIGAAIKAGLTAAALSGAIALAVGTTIAKAQPKAMAMGGVPATGTLFYAGEAGAETVTVGSSGRTEVTNVSQMETALYNALVRYGRENRGGDSAIQINIDGQRVFEAVQRTANKKGLGFSRV